MDTTDAPLRLALVYWGRRGITRLTLDVARAMVALPTVEPVVSIARANEAFAAHGWLGERLLPVTTFASAWGIAPALARLPWTLARVRQEFLARRVEVVLVLMPHLWTPLLAPRIKRAGLGYVVVAHDGVGHAGDPTALVNRWLERDLARADRVVTLSRSVAAKLEARGLVRPDRLRTLWLPDQDQADQDQAIGRVAPRGERLRLLFFGRILRYKGLEVLVEAAERLAADGLPITLGVVGDGELGPLADRLRALGAEVDNRWIAETEVAALLARYDVVVLPYRGASQSGVIAAAHGAGLPVVVTPVGGLVEQVAADATGLVAAGTGADDLAAALRRLLVEPGLLPRLRAGVAAGREQRSVTRFAEALAAVAAEVRPRP